MCRPLRSRRNPPPEPDPAGFISAVMESDAIAEAAREISLELAQREAAEAALAQATAAGNALREQLKAVRRDLAACQARVAHAEAGAAAGRVQESSARQECRQLQVRRLPLLDIANTRSFTSYSGHHPLP